jgi:predicted ATPase/DNA-binding SARP family transcriptional activator
MEFRVLGPLEVLRNGAPVRVGGPKPRALLATLLVHAGSVVPTSRLVAAVWPGGPPPDAVGALRAYVSRLRAVLPPLPGEERLRHRTPGYQLMLADGELDGAAFEGLVRCARESTARDDHGTAVDQWDAALAMWRGEPLGEFDVAAMDAAPLLTQWSELRLGAREDRAAALLELGRASDAVLDLQALVRECPDRERPAVLLMQALYDCGRQADGLAVFRELRRRLVDELGIEPSETTQRVHRQLLAHDPRLGPPVGRPGTDLPRRSTRLVGRDDEVDRLVALLDGAPLVTLTGPGGVGKSRLALEVAGRVGGAFPDGVWLCELAPLRPGGPVGSAVAGALRVQQRHGLTIEQTVLAYLRARRSLLVLDNCEHVLDAAADLLDRLLPSCPRVAVLATSREAIGVPGELVRPLPPLSADAAATLFAQRAQATRPDFRLDSESAGAVAAICHRLDGLPLAIELAAARMGAMSATELARRLAAEGPEDDRLLTHAPRLAPARHQSLNAAIAWSYRLLSAPEQQLFVRTSVFAGGADLAAVHAVCGAPDSSESDTLELLSGLIDKSMVIPVASTGGTRYRVLETLRAYGREQLLDRKTDAGALADRHAAYYVTLAEQAAVGVQGPDERAWVERTMPDRENFRTAFELLISRGDADSALRLVTALPEVAQVRLGYEFARWAERALDLTPVDHPLYVAAVGAAARGAWNVGDFGRARRLAALAGGRPAGRGTARSGHPADVAVDVGLYEGDVDSALRHYTHQVALARRADDRLRLVWSLYYVAICQAVRREPEQGLPAARECLLAADDLANPTARSMARYALGLVLKKSRPAEALALFDEAASLAAAVHNFWWHGIAMMEAAATRAVHADPHEAAQAFLEVLDHWDRVGDWTQQWLALRYVIRLLVRLGCTEDAVVLHAALQAAGKPSPLSGVRAAALLDGPLGPRSAAAAARGSALSPEAAVALARTCLIGAG